MVMRTSAAPNLDPREAGEPSNGVAIPVELDLPRRDDDDEWRPLLAGAVAHELRATLALISGYSQSLLHLPVDEATRRRYLERILSATEALAEFADQIMDVAGPGDVRVLRRRPVALEWLASRLAREIASEPEQAPIRYEQTLDLPLVDVDPTWVGHVLRNLVRNALQHGAAGVVAVQARPLNGMVVVTVRDDGPGFEPDEYDLSSGRSTVVAGPTLRDETGWVSGSTCVASSSRRTVAESGSTSRPKAARSRSAFRQSSRPRGSRTRRACTTLSVCPSWLPWSLPSELGPSDRGLGSPSAGSQPRAHHRHPLNFGPGGVGIVPPAPSADHSAHKRHDDRAEEAAGVTEGELAPDPSAHDPPDHTDEHICEAAAGGAAWYQHPRQGAGDKAHHDPADQVHVQHPRPSRRAV